MEESVRRTILRHEDRLRTLRHERLLAFDEEGGIVYSVDGEAASVFVPEEDWLRLQGRVVTHNHPRGWAFASGDPRHAGNSFSLSDLELACRAKVAEMRAVSVGYRHLIRPPAEGWDAAFFESALRPAFEDTEAAVTQEFTAAVRGRRMRGATAEATFYHEIVERLSRELGMEYRRVK